MVVDINQFVSVLTVAYRDLPVMMVTVVPRHALDNWISYYWHLGFPDTKVAVHALDHFDRNVYGLGYVFQLCAQK